MIVLEQLAKWAIAGICNFIQVIDQSFKIEMLIYSDKLLTMTARQRVRQARCTGIPLPVAALFLDTSDLGMILPLEL